MKVDDTGLNYSNLIVIINFQDTVHLGHLDDNSAFGCYGTTAQVCSRTPGEERRFMLNTTLYNLATSSVDLGSTTASAPYLLSVSPSHS